MTIPFAEFCIMCDLGSPDLYETFHRATREQITSLVEHVGALKLIPFIHFVTGVTK